MSKQKSNPISVPSLCELYGKDPSQMRKMIDKLGIKKITVRRPEDNKVVTAISDADHQKLVDSFSNLTTGNATKQDVALADACKKLGYKEDQMSNFTRACGSWDIEIYEKRFEGRTQKCISLKDFKKAKALRTIAMVDVD